MPQLGGAYRGARSRVLAVSRSPPAAPSTAVNSGVAAKKWLPATHTPCATHGDGGVLTRSLPTRTGCRRTQCWVSRAGATPPERCGASWGEIQGLELCPAHPGSPVATGRAKPAAVLCSLAGDNRTPTDVISWKIPACPEASPADPRASCHKGELLGWRNPSQKCSTAVHSQPRQGGFFPREGCSALDGHNAPRTPSPAPNHLKAPPVTLPQGRAWVHRIPVSDLLSPADPIRGMKARQDTRLTEGEGV